MTWTTRHGRDLSNVHRRAASDPAAAWSLVTRMADPAARAWPTARWPALTLDAGMTVGSSGGHGPVPYRVAATEPGRIRFELLSPFDGWHEYRLEGRDLVHELWLVNPGWFVRHAVVPLHDALIEDFLDNVEDRIRDPGGPDRLRPFSARVRLLRLVARM